MVETASFDVVVVGAGPAGIAAALSASSDVTPNVRVAIIDENPMPGGQIYRATGAASHPAISSDVLEVERRGVVQFAQSTVIDAPSDGKLVVSNSRGVTLIKCRSTVLATGARELFLPFPGWTLPNVMGVGGLQALVKSGLDVRGKRIVVSGSGPLLPAVGAYLRDHGAIVPIVAEQASAWSVSSFLSHLLRYPSKLRQGAGLLARIGTAIRSGAWVESATGIDKLEEATIRMGSKSKTVSCDYLACAYGFVPNVELATLIGCHLSDGFVTVDNRQATTVANVYCAGEPTGIGGVDLSEIEGQIAGLAAAAKVVPAALSAKREKWQSFARRMDRAFTIRQDIRELARPETVLCRCEDVAMSQVVGMRSAREAKLHTRCGMGACQGRICGPATRFLFGWEAGTVRPPLVPAALTELITNDMAGDLDDLGR